MSIKNQLFLKDKNVLHHAYLITGDIKSNVDELRGVIEKIVGTSLDSYPDYYLHFTPSFSVADSRQIIERQKTKSFGPDAVAGAGAGMRFFVIASYSFTNEAQNGLLKVLEDPIAGNHFFILSTTEEILLPTLRSRMMHIDGSRTTETSVVSWCEEFVATDIVNRMIMIEKFVKDEDKDGEEKLVKHKTMDILNCLEKIFFDQLGQGSLKQNEIDAHFLAEVLGVKQFLNDTAPAIRMILEYIAFICPIKS